MNPALRQTVKGILVSDAYQFSMSRPCFCMGIHINPATIDRSIGTFLSHNKGLLRANFPRIVEGTLATA